MSGTITVIFTDKSGRSAYFSFDEIGDSTVANDFKTGTHADIHGEVAAAPGILNGGAYFNEKGYLTQPIYDELQFGNNDFSIELLMKSTDDDGYVFCIGTHNKTNVEGGSGNWVGLERLKNSSTDRLCFSIDDDATKSDCYALNPSNFFDGNWHHVVCVRNAIAKSTSIYIDGKQNMTNNNVGTGALKFNPTELMWIGGDDEPTSGRENRTFNGDIDEFYIYPFVLSPEDVKANFERYDLSAVDQLIAESGDARFTIVDVLTGRIVVEAKGEAGTSLTAGLEKGVYVLVIEQNGSKKTRKFIKH